MDNLLESVFNALFGITPPDNNNVKIGGRKYKRTRIKEKTKLSRGRDLRERKEKKARKMAERSRRINRSRL